jgi:hypothetical protein
MVFWERYWDLGEEDITVGWITYIYSAAVSPSFFEGHKITSITKVIRFKANWVSSAMDTAHGGFAKHGGYHRLFGGHSSFDWKNWNRFGPRYATELAKDSLTPNGLPLPGVETAIRNKWISVDFANKWGTMHIGKMAAAGVGILDTGWNVSQYLMDRERLAEKSSQVMLKGALKVAAGSIHGNLPLAAMGLVDVCLAGCAKVDQSFEFDMSSEEDAWPYLSFAFS